MTLTLTNDVLLKTIWKHKKKKVDHHRYCVIMWCANENNMTNINFAQIVSKHKWASIVSSHKYKWAFPFTIDQWFLFPNIIIYAHNCYRCFFGLLVIPLSYNFGGHFRNTYPPISLEYRPLEAMRPSFLASEPSSTYTFIGPWCKLTSKMLLITFFKLLFLNNCVMSRSFWRVLSSLPSCFYGAHFSFYYQHGQHVEGVTIIESSSGMK